jgi:hypothetical protein
VHAGLHPVELGEHVVGQVEPPVGQDVALDPAQHAERRERLVGRRDLLALAADVVGGQAGHGADGGRVVADRDVVVAAVARGAAHLLDARAAVRPRRVAVEVAADVARLDQRRRLAAERVLAQLGRAPREAERGVHRLLGRRVGQRAERGEIGRRAGGLDERRAEPLGRGGDELERDAVDGHAERAPLLALDHGDDLRQLGEAVEQRGRVGRHADDGQHLAGVAPAADVAGHDALERGRDALGELAGAGEQEPGARARLWVAGERGHEPRLGLRADAGDVGQAARGGGLAQLVGRAHLERAGDLQRPPRGQAEVAAEPDQLRRQLALELGELRDPAGLDELAKPPFDATSDPAQLAHPPGAHEGGDVDPRVADRLRGAAVGAGRVRVRLGELEQRRERLQAVGDLAVADHAVARISRSASARSRSISSGGSWTSYSTPSIATRSASQPRSSSPVRYSLRCSSIGVTVPHGVRTSSAGACSVTRAS